MPVIPVLGNRHMKITPAFAPPARAFGAAPAPLVLLRELRSPLPPSLRSGACGLLRRLREPAAFGGRDQGHALFPFAASQAGRPSLRSGLVLLRGPWNPPVSSAAPGAGTLRLRLRVGLPSHAAEPPAASPCGPRSPAASLGLRLARRRSPRVEAKPHCGFAFNIYNSRTMSFYICIRK